MPGGGDLEFGVDEDRTHFEMAPQDLANELNALDLGVKILDFTLGDIDPEITHTVTDKQGKSKKIMSQSARQAEYGPRKYIWRGLRMITERRIGELKQEELRKRFPNYHIDGPQRKKMLEDKERMKKYPNAVEYYFSPKKPLRDKQRKKHPYPPMYGKSRRTIQQQKRYMKEAKENNLLNPDNSLNRNKLLQKLRMMIEDEIGITHFPVITHKVDKFVEQFVSQIKLEDQDRERQSDLNDEKGRVIQMMSEVARAEIPDIQREEMNKILKDKKAINSISSEYEGTATPLASVFKSRIYNVSIEMLKDRISDMVSRAQKNNKWPNVKEHFETYFKEEEAFLERETQYQEAHREKIRRRQQELNPQQSYPRPHRGIPHRRGRRGTKGRKHRTRAQMHNDLQARRRRGGLPGENKKASVWFDTIRGIQ